MAIRLANESEKKKKEKENKKPTTTTKKTSNLSYVIWRHYLGTPRELVLVGYWEKKRSS